MSLREQKREYEQRIKELKAAGYEVYVKHWPKDEGLYYSKRHTPKYFTDALAIKDGVWYRGVAYCSPKDQPNRKLGWSIAVGRLLKNIEVGRTLYDNVQ